MTNHEAFALGFILATQLSMAALVVMFLWKGEQVKRMIRKQIDDYRMSLNGKPFCTLPCDNIKCIKAHVRAK